MDTTTILHDYTMGTLKDSQRSTNQEANKPPKVVKAKDRLSIKPVKSEEK